MSGTETSTAVAGTQPEQSFGGVEARSDAKINTVSRISVRNLDFYYAANKALKAINLELPDRQVTGMIGPSG